MMPTRAPSTTDDGDHDERDRHGELAADEEPGEHVAAVAVGADDVPRAAGRRREKMAVEPQAEERIGPAAAQERRLASGRRVELGDHREGRRIDFRRHRMGEGDRMEAVIGEEVERLRRRVDRILVAGGRIVGREEIRKDGEDQEQCDEPRSEHAHRVAAEATPDEAEVGLRAHGAQRRRRRVGDERVGPLRRLRLDGRRHGDVGENRIGLRVRVGAGQDRVGPVADHAHIAPAWRTRGSSRPRAMSASRLATTRIADSHRNMVAVTQMSLR